MLSDPGLPLIQAAYAKCINVTSIPGASALTACIGVCPIPLNEFQFIGFIERRESLKRIQLAELLAYPLATVCFESPKRLLNTLTLIRDLGYGDRLIFVCRELTKLHEEKRFGAVDQIFNEFSSREKINGEIVLVFAPNETSRGTDQTADRLVKLFADEDVPPSSAARLISKLTPLTRQEAYQKFIVATDDE